MTEDVLHIIQHYRHDLMNRLQLVSGYLSMGKVEKAEDKLNEAIAYYEEERKLMQLKAPSLMLWILEFEQYYRSYSMSYFIEATSTTYNHPIDDQWIVSKCNQIMHVLQNHLYSDSMYEVEIRIIDNIKKDQWNIIFGVQGNIPNMSVDVWQSNLGNIQIERFNDRLQFVFSQTRE
ncbi:MULTISPECIES: Spo0B domain-containing protein [Oceanobacillus]|uniref:SpoOB alpha-helical domain-containing protein n=1 Tax=Oceanobacillus kimchii TaxID=746691 RepID=A0ABQ5TLQ9_9BACI|nr:MULTISPECIES: Spo0B domain-containing protein [Oceanobacillus]MBT2598203.1 Spo0B domain-containing protein [Oceanobacillus sp. ISL-74]MBT2651122.1 Spo0B domain-containing protein [Oceanobacillus sp. ISL-73]MCT1575781.1 Spo0B domain-containing protein [Oceanobacillus kimchii]MCT2135418.1 Spo0B domain-containing protein [Oceanobacillus kimchii]OEH55528.1 hypothetical protein AQ616_04935 [Oceanobacillus sp. E9]